MEFIELKANVRETTGKCNARALRRDGLVPAILYGKNDPVMLSVPYIDLENAFKESQTAQVFITLLLEGGSSLSAMIKEYQVEPLERNLLHVDFYEIAMDQKISVKVPVTVTGKAIGVEMGGHLQIIRRVLEIKCLAQDVPENFELDVTDLDIGDSIHVKDIEPPEGIEIPFDVNFTVVTLSMAKKIEEEEEEVEGEEGEEGEEGVEGAEGEEGASEEGATASDGK